MDEETLNELAYWEGRLAELPADRPKKVDRNSVAKAFQDAFDASGGAAGLAMWASRNRGDFYRMYGKLMPKETHSTHDGTLKVVHSIAPSALDQETGNTYDAQIAAEGQQGTLCALPNSETGVWEGSVQGPLVQGEVHTEERH